MTTPFFDHLELETQAARHNLLAVPQLTDALQGRISRDTYLAYLQEAYHHVKHTVPLLMATGARLQPRNQWMQKAIAEYIEEEQGHEQWILNDIAAAGGDRVKAASDAPRFATQVLVAYNYDYIARHNPVGFLGMVYMLESTSIALATQGAQTLQRSLDLPVGAFSYLLSHGTVDEDHIVFYQQLVNRIENDDDKRAIVEVANNTFYLFAELLRSIPHSAAGSNGRDSANSGNRRNAEQAHAA